MAGYEWERPYIQQTDQERDYFEEGPTDLSVVQEEGGPTESDAYAYPFCEYSHLSQQWFTVLFYSQDSHSITVVMHVCSRVFELLIGSFFHTAGPSLIQSNPLKDFKTLALHTGMLLVISTFSYPLSI